MGIPQKEVQGVASDTMRDVRGHLRQSRRTSHPQHSVLPDVCEHTLLLEGHTHSDNDSGYVWARGLGMAPAACSEGSEPRRRPRRVFEGAGAESNYLSVTRGCFFSSPAQIWIPTLVIL